MASVSIPSGASLATASLTGKGVSWQWKTNIYYTTGYGTFRIWRVYGIRNTTESRSNTNVTITITGANNGVQYAKETQYITVAYDVAETANYWQWERDKTTYPTGANFDFGQVGGITDSRIKITMYIATGPTSSYWPGGSGGAATFTWYIDMPACTNSISHWAGGFNNGEGNNGSKTMFNLTYTSFTAYPGNSITYNSSRATTIPNGFALSSSIGSSNWNNGTWKTYTMPVTLTQPASNTSMQYDYYPNSYSISYTMNGGTNSSSNPSSYNVLYGVTFANPSRTGYTFKNWTIGGTAVTGINPGANASFSSSSDLYSKLSSRTTGNKTVVANWTANTYTVNFNANGGSTPTASKTVTYASTYGTLPTPTRDGYDFNGWYTAASGGSKITSSTTVSITSTQTLYAQWSAKTYTITYDANGGTGAPDAQTKTHGIDLVLSTTEPTRANEKQNTFTVMFTDKDGYLNIPSRTCETYNKYTFTGWDEEKNVMMASYAPGGKYTANASATLYANWRAVLIREAITLPTAEECQREGYELLGFSTTPTGTVEYAPGEEYSPFENITLYAIWSGGQTFAKYKINGQWVSGELYVKYNGAWKQAKQIYIKQNGTWKQGKNS